MQTIAVTSETMSWECRSDVWGATATRH